jgi:PAS domain S-box-containing protein
MFNGEIRNRNVFMTLQGFDTRHVSGLPCQPRMRLYLKSSLTFRARPRPVMSHSSQPSARILIVEDNELDALLLQEALKKAAPGRVDLMVANRVSEAVRFLSENRFDVILSDLTLPDAQGMNTFTLLHAQAPDTPIILLTGYESESLGLDAVRSGAQEYIVKGTMNEKALWRVISYAIERQTLQRALRDSEQRFKRLLGSVTDYIYTVKVDHGRPVSTTHGLGCIRVTGYTPEDFERDSHLWHHMVREEDRMSVLKQAARVLAGDCAVLEHRIIHKDGAIRWVRHTPVVRRDENEQVIGYDGLISDITERKEAEEALRQAVNDLQKSQEALKSAHLQLIQAEKMESVGRMAAGVAHEVQNPLQILLMSLDYIGQRMEDANDSVLDGVISDMREAARRADTIIRGLLDFSHSDQLELTPQDINTLIEKALLLIGHQLAVNHVTLQTELGGNLPPLALDGVKIEQVFVNLCTNAIDAMPKGGALTVRTFTEKLAETQRDPGSREACLFYAGDTVIIVEVEDTGSGIPPEALRKIFDPFFTTKATGKGTGLGLAIVRRILDLHGGAIEVRNRPEGGTCFRLMFKAKNKGSRANG